MDPRSERGQREGTSLLDIFATLVLVSLRLASPREVVVIYPALIKGDQDVCAVIAGLQGHSVLLHLFDRDRHHCAIARRAGMVFRKRCMVRLFQGEGEEEKEKERSKKEERRKKIGEGWTDLA